MFTNRFVIIGFARCFPYYLIGYLLHNKIVLTEHDKTTIIITTILTGIISISLSFYIYDISSFMLRILVQQLVCVCAITFFTGISIILNPFKWDFIINISIGTMVIFGLHWALIGLFNQTFQHLYGIPKITYSPWQVLSIAIVIEAILYPLIVKLPPMWLGKKKNYIIHNENNKR
jgi:hypothetical protein